VEEDGIKITYDWYIENYEKAAAGKEEYFIA
jgi:hypothetical protein